MKNERKHIEIKIFGKLKEQGIRFSAMHEAYKSCVYGITKYTDDDAVYIEAEGSPEQVERFKGWCLKIADKYNKGEIEINYNKIVGYTEFKLID